MSWEMFVSLKANLFERKLTFRQKVLSLSADGAQQELACKLKLLFVKRKAVFSAIMKTVVSQLRWGSLNHLSYLSSCGAPHRCYKHTQLVFTHPPPLREPARHNYSAVSTLTSYFILSSGDFGALSVVFRCFSVELHFSFVNVLRKLWKPKDKCLSGVLRASYRQLDASLNEINLC